MPRLKTGLQKIAHDRLHVSPLNDKTREIDQDRRDQLRKALEKAPEHLEARPLIVDVDGAIIGGRHRWEEARALIEADKPSPFRRRFKDGQLPVYVRNFKDDAERLEWLTRDNADYAGWVPDELAPLIAGHQAAGADLEMLGLPKQEIDDLLELVGDPHFEPTPPDGRLDHQLTRTIDCPHCGKKVDVPAVSTTPTPAK